jgi:FMN phosphatase YigB (HAD superfamily)
MEPTAVTLDAHGTLIDIDDPVPRIARMLAEAGYPNTEAQTRKGFRAEVAYYLRNVNDGRDPRALDDLRLRCARVMRTALVNRPPPPLLRDILMESLRFRLFPDVEEALGRLQAQGRRLAVISNWDCSLGSTLAELGIADRFALIMPSAVAGVSKPDRAIFDRTLDALGVPASHALHCGDVADVDSRGARMAGMAAVHLDRSAAAASGHIPSLARLPERAAALLPGIPAAS